MSGCHRIVNHSTALTRMHAHTHKHKHTRTHTHTHTDCSTTGHGPIGEWDVSQVRNMFNTFYGATSFNHDLAKWNVDTVTEMSGIVL